jgi:hypothetical protein
VRVEGGGERVGRDGRAPGGVQAADVETEGGADAGEPVAEIAADGGEDGVARGERG